MLERIDRVLLTARDADATAQRWCEVLDATVVRHDQVPELAARRVVVHAGDSEVEILAPTGDGLVADHLASDRGGVFAAGAAAHDVDRIAARLGGIRLGAQLLLDAATLRIPGLRMVISPMLARPRVGLITGLYEVTHLTADAQHATDTFAERFALVRRNFVPIRSEQFGYDGTLTLFAPDRLHRIETIHPFDRAKTMGRYFDRFGASLYMCYAETDALPKLRERLMRVAPNDWTGSVDDNNGLFVHPRALGGVMLGVSRQSYAWTWSGHPERVSSA